jgi:hypothetical protein
MASQPARPHPTPPGRRTSTFREDRILPHLPALHILLTGRLDESDPPCSMAPTAIEVIDYLRAQEITITYEPETRSLRTGGVDHHRLESLTTPLTPWRFGRAKGGTQTIRVVTSAEHEGR